MDLIKAKNEYVFEDLIGVAVRENNQNRQFLFINRLQGKYVPASPKESIKLFHALGRAASGLKGDTVTVIGFAETATALGAFAAETFGEETFYLHTTRTKAAEIQELISFEEEHSHAKNHRLYCRDAGCIRSSDLVILVDDEFTTGRTICNLIDAMRTAELLKPDANIAAASIFSCMSERDFKEFDKRGIQPISLLSRKPHDYELGIASAAVSENAKEAVENPGEISNLPEREADFKVIKLAGKRDLHSGIRIGDYRCACEDLARSILESCEIGTESQRILVLGTEEFMYPAIIFAQQLQTGHPNKAVRVQATGRSPILPMSGQGYAIKTRAQVSSIYDQDRTVYLYNIEKYDKVFVLTDAQSDGGGSFIETAGALKKAGNDDITLVYWEE